MTDVIDLFEKNPYLGVIALLSILLAYFFRENKKNSENRLQELDTQVKVITDESTKIRDGFIFMRQETLAIKDQLTVEMTSIIRDIDKIRSEITVLNSQFSNDIESFKQEYGKTRQIILNLDEAEKQIKSNQGDLMAIKKILIKFRNDIEVIKGKGNG